VTSIEWTDETWNPVTGCSKVSPGCAHCYAEALSLRFGWSKKSWTPEHAEENVVLRPDRLSQPLKWRQPRMVFVNSMSDLFHELVPDQFIADVFEQMGLAGHHVFQVLTKRPERMRDLLDSGAWRKATGISEWPLSNVWLGTSIENRHFLHRADALRETWAAVRFISAEPLLGPLSPATPDDYGEDTIGGLDLRGIDWLIAGGESGPKRRSMNLDWVRDLRDAAVLNGTAFFYKQGNGFRPGMNRLLDGREWNEMPRQAVSV
jgi:protein gp37